MGRQTEEPNKVWLEETPCSPVRTLTVNNVLMGYCNPAHFHAPVAQWKSALVRYLGSCRVRCLPGAFSLPAGLGSMPRMKAGGESFLWSLQKILNNSEKRVDK